MEFLNVMSIAYTNEQLRKYEPKILPLTTNSLLRFSNKYVRKQTGELEKSSIVHSELDKGVINYQKSYAYRVYNYGVPLTNVNSNAKLEWVDYAIEHHRDDIESEITLLIEKGL